MQKATREQISMGEGYAGDLVLSLLILPGVHSDMDPLLPQRLQERGFPSEIVRLTWPPAPQQRFETWQPYREYSVDARWSPVRAALYGLCFCQAPVVALASGGIPLSEDLLVQMLQTGRSTQAEILIASRFVGGSRPQYPWHRLILSSAFRAISRLVVGRRISDPRSGLKMFPRKALLEALAEAASSSSDLHLPPLAYLRRARVTEVPVQVQSGDLYYPLTLRVLLAVVRDILRAPRHRKAHDFRISGSSL